MNRVVGQFTMEAADAFRTADALEARYRRLQTSLASVGKINVTVTGTFDREVSKVLGEQRKIIQLQVEQQRLAKATANAESAVEKVKRDQVSTDIRQVQLLKEKVRLEEAQLRLERSRNRPATPSSLGASLGLGGAVSVGGTVLAAAAFASAVEKTVGISNDAARANRVLASSATEAGLAFSDAAEKNRKFAEAVGLSERQAASTTGAILRLAARTGQPKKADELLGGFADLGAAFGIQSQDLQTLIGTILSGQDEGLNRLGIADPGQLYKAYAKDIGKSVEELTQFEKVQAAVNAVMDKAGMFAGAASDRMASLEGRTAKAAAAWDKLTTNIATSLTQSPILSEALRTYTDLFGALAVNIDEVNKKLSEGKSPEQVAKELYPQPSISDVLQSSLSGVGNIQTLTRALGLGAVGSSVVGDSSLQDVYTRNFRNFVDQVRSQSQLNQKQADAAKQATEAQEAQIKKAEEQAAAQERVNRKVDEYKDLIGKTTQTVASLEELRSKVKNDDSLGAKNVESVNKAIDQAVERNIERAVDQVNKMKETWSDVTLEVTKAAHSTNPLVSATLDADKAMADLLEKTKGMPEGLRQSVIQMREMADASKLFDLKLDSALQALDLRETAAKFRGTGYQATPGETDEEYRRRKSGYFDRAINAGYFSRDQLAARTGPNGELQMSQEERDRVSRSYLLAAARELPGLTDFNRDTVTIGAARLLEQRRAEDLSVNERLRKQLDVIDSLKPGSDAERAAADRKTIALAANLRPEDLDPNLRNRVASAAEREADRLVRQEADAQRVREEQRDYLKSISEQITTFLGIAKQGGTGAIEATIKVSEESGMVQDVTKTSRPGPRSTADVYNFGGFSFAGGSNR